mmetsp:Transcript_35954/g.80036  ORF Transcript_35954/g.80036 Transcript_35954/m.80036 type:complete len:256 (+) Transcript_35954:737-1504(+)
MYCCEQHALYCLYCLDQGQLLVVGTGARLEVHVGLVGLLDHLVGVGLVLALIVEAKLVGGLAVRDLVVTEPLQDLLQLTGEVLLHVSHVVHQRGLGVIHADGNDLPVQLAVINHGVHTQGLNLVHAAALASSTADLNDVHWVVVTRGVELGVLVGGVLPGLGQQAIVPVDVVGVEAQLALLHVLLDGGADLVSGNLHLCGSLLGNLADVVQQAITSVQGDLVPRRHQLLTLLEEQAVLQGVLGPLLLSLVCSDLC